MATQVVAAVFDWCNLNMVSTAHHQLNNDCWANASTEALECSYLIRNNRHVVLSAQPVLDHLKLHTTRIGAPVEWRSTFF